MEKELEAIDGDENVEELVPMLRQQIPAAWLEDRQKRFIAISIWQTMCVPEADVKGFYRNLDVGTVHLFIRHAKLDLPAPLDLTFISADVSAVKVHVDTPPKRQYPLGTYSFFATPVGATSVDEVMTPALDNAFPRIRLAVALTSACLGTNCVFREIYKAVASLDSSAICGPPTMLPTPFIGQKPDLAMAKLQHLHETARAVESLAPEARTKVDLSLRWYLMSSDEDSIDSLLRIWIAIETIGMRRGNEYRRVGKTLARIYSLDEEAARARFKIGLIYKVRCMIVHEGLMDRRLRGLVPYLHAVYEDLLHDFLDRPPIFATQTILALPSCSLEDMLGRYA